MACNRIKINTKQIVCAGDLRYPITIYIRDLKAPTNVDFTYDLSNYITARAGVEIANSINDVSGTNTENKLTHIFYIRYDENARNSYLVEYDNLRYTVISTENVDFQRKFMKINTSETGISTNEVNIL